MQAVYKCVRCEKSFAHNSSLSRHKLCHKTEDGQKENEVDLDGQSRKPTFWCNSTDCGCGFISAASLLKHLEEHHNLDLHSKQKNISFPSFASFLEWKNEEEARTRSKYVQRCSPQTSGEAITYYFYCNRSGVYKPRGNGIRSLKSQGSSKLNSYCTAHMKVKQLLPDKQIVMDYCPLHHNHQLEIAHLPIPHDVRLSIASKIQQGVTIERILDDIRESLDGACVNREHLTNRRDVLNIRKQINFENIQKHKDDYVSVLTWVNEMKEKECANPVLAFKQQGIEDENGILAKDDFLLVIQTPFQLEMLQQFGNKAVCVDSTHGTNMYDFLLITIMVIDDHEEGLPIAWAVSNKEDELSLTTFFKAVYAGCSDIKPALFMSDDAAQFWNSWRAVFGLNTTHKCLCTWHVDRSWRNALVRHVNDVPARAEIYHNLRVLLAETKKEHFAKLMQHCMSFLASKHPDFGTYFRTYYLNRVEEWAYCHRIGTLINTNMHVEAFHRVLKYIYLNGKKNRRIDHLLHILLKIARDKSFEQVQKSHKGKITHRISQMSKRHAEALEMVTKGLKPVTVNDISWKVPSQTQSSQSYIVESLEHSCVCKIKCRGCGVCPQSYNCTCIDYAIHNTACKHIHCVSISQSTASSSRSVAMLTQDSVVDCSLLQDSQTQGTKSDPDCIRNKIQSKLNEIQILSRSTDTSSTLNSVLSHLTSAASILKSEEQALACSQASTSKKNKNPPQNQLVERQRFYSTKRKRERSAPYSLNKPTAAETSQVKNKLLAVEVTICSICYKEDDSGDADDIPWLQCSLCRLWFHYNCIKSTCDTNTEFKCLSCMTL